MPTYKLTYFNGRGRAEAARLVFAKAGVPYEDVRITFEQWGAMKDSTLFGSLPMLEVDGVRLGQSYPVAAFLAKRFGLHGKTDIEEAQVDGVNHALIDLSDGVIKYMFEKDETNKPAQKKSLEEEKIPNVMKFLGRILEKNGTGFFVGKNMTLADINFAYAVETFQSLGLHFDFSKCPKLQGVLDKVNSDPKIAEWIKKRPETPF